MHNSGTGVNFSNRNKSFRRSSQSKTNTVNINARQQQKKIMASVRIAVLGLLAGCWLKVNHHCLRLSAVYFVSVSHVSEWTNTNKASCTPPSTESDHSGGREVSEVIVKSNECGHDEDYLLSNVSSCAGSSRHTKRLRERKNKKKETNK